MGNTKTMDWNFTFRCPLMFPIQQFLTLWLFWSIGANQNIVFSSAALFTHLPWGEQPHCMFLVQYQIHWLHLLLLNRPSHHHWHKSENDPSLLPEPTGRWRNSTGQLHQGGQWNSQIIPHTCSKQHTCLPIKKPRNTLIFSILKSAVMFTHFLHSAKLHQIQQELHLQ